MKAKHVAYAAGAALGLWAFFRARKADAAGVPWDMAFKYWSKSIPEVQRLIDERREALETIARGENVNAQPW